MKQMLIAGNWKMNTTSIEAEKLCGLIAGGLMKMPRIDVKILVCPPAVNISNVGRVIKGSRISLGAQNCHYERKGAYTGEISVSMLSHLGCEYIIAGHSERRAYCAETNELINKKAVAILSGGLIPIICIGESLEQRKAMQTFEILENQLNECLYGFAESDMENIAVAYEPVWAIGTGVAASVRQVDEAHNWIRNYLNNAIGAGANNTILLYGGSMNADNAGELLRLENVNGGLIGGASLTADSFLSIIHEGQNAIRM